VFFIKDIIMNLSPISKQLLDWKREKNLTFADIGQKLGRDEVWVAALFYGQASFPDDKECKKLLDILGVNNLSSEQMHELTHPPFKGSIIPSFPPTDPLLYRFHEILLQFGVPMKEVIHEKFGDGIMSAVDFTVKIDKDETNKEAPRVNINMSGKFLPYKRW
jgi:cyanate lyase